MKTSSGYPFEYTKNTSATSDACVPHNFFPKWQIYILLRKIEKVPRDIRIA